MNIKNIHKVEKLNELHWKLVHLIIEGETRDKNRGIEYVSELVICIHDGYSGCTGKKRVEFEVDPIIALDILRAKLREVRKEMEKLGVELEVLDTVSY